MDIALQGASKAEELIRLEDPRSHYAFAKIFEAKGWGAGRRNRERLKLLQNLDAELSRMLHDGERIVAVTWGQEYSFFESYFLGAWAMLLNRRALLLTTERLLLLQINWRKQLLELKSQIRYGAIRKLGGSWLGQLQVKLAKGKGLMFTQIPRAMRKPFAQALEAQRASAPVSPIATREHLCPHCYEPLVEVVPACPKCRGTFKSASRARWLSLAFPGVGDLYLGHRLLGGFQIAGAALMWMILVPAMLAGASGGEGAAAAIPLFVVCLMAHAIDAWVTGHTAGKGLYPEKPGSAAR
jgi:hypothetical protein